MLARICRQLSCVSLSVPLSETAQSCDIHALRGSSSGTNEKCQTSSSHVHPPSGHRSGLSLVVELLKEATLSVRLCEQKDDGTACRTESMAAEGWFIVTERGTTGAGEPQIAGVPRVHRSLELDGRGTIPRWTKSRPGWRPACWTQVKAKPKYRPMSGAGDSRMDQMSLRQQLRKKESMRTSYREMPFPLRFLERVLCKEYFPCIKDSQERALPKGGGGPQGK